MVVARADLAEGQELVMAMSPLSPSKLLTAFPVGACREGVVFLYTVV